MANPSIDAPELVASPKAADLNVPHDQFALNVPDRSANPEIDRSLPTVKLDRSTPLDTNYPKLHEANVARAQQGADIVIDGDSIVQRLGNHAQSTNEILGANVASLGVTSDTSDQLSSRLLNGEASFPDGKRPKVAVVMIGTNDLGNGDGVDDNAVVQGIEKAVITAHETMPGTKIMVAGLLPRGAEYFNGDEQKATALNARISEINHKVEQWIQKYPEQGIYYADLGSKFLPNNTSSVPSDLMSDGLHPSGDGLTQLQYALRDAIASVSDGRVASNDTPATAPQTLTPDALPTKPDAPTTSTPELPSPQITRAPSSYMPSGGNGGGANDYYSGGAGPYRMAGGGGGGDSYMPSYPQAHGGAGYQHRPFLGGGGYGFNDGAIGGPGLYNPSPNTAFDSLATWLLSQGIDINNLDPTQMEKLAKEHPELAKAAQLALKFKNHEKVTKEDVENAGLPKDIAQQVNDNNINVGDIKTVRTTQGDVQLAGIGHDGKCLQPDAAKAFLAAEAEAKRDGITIDVSEAWRNANIQAKYYEHYLDGTGGLAAAPGNSNHETGNAIDIRNFAQAAPYLERHGFFHGDVSRGGLTRLPNDQVHFVFPGGEHGAIAMKHGTGRSDDG